MRTLGSPELQITIASALGITAIPLGQFIKEAEPSAITDPGVPEHPVTTVGAENSPEAAFSILNKT
jgi:hypothetical protein